MLYFGLLHVLVTTPALNLVLDKREHPKCFILFFLVVDL